MQGLVLSEYAEDECAWDRKRQRGRAEVANHIKGGFFLTAPD